MARGVFERPKGSGIWWIRYTDQFGKLHREKVGPKSLALSAYQKRKTEIREGKFFPEKVKRKREMLFEDMARLYLEEHSKVNKISWKTDLRRFKRIINHFGNRPLSEITRQDIERFRAILLQDLKAATVNRYMALLKNLFNKAIVWGKCKHNPVRGINQFKEIHRIRFLTEEEEGRLKSAFPDRYWPWVEVALHTGLRQSEQFQLRWENVNFQTRIITIPRSKDGGTRHIPINDQVMEILGTFPSRLRTQWVFPSSTGKTPMNARNFVQRVFYPALRKAEIKDFRWHDLRHTFASRLVMAGEDLRTVQELMGHKTITMTQKYSHLSPAHLMKAVQRLVREPTDTKTDTKNKKGVADSS
ncbi:MAG: tyrosine-type recombinase/integrase [Candidatus Aenigmarchaeota archaeon]|nr:tyrosine-type recombinase/integrase [Candidatus Aenigmarchaeota archaeon]